MPYKASFAKAIRDEGTTLRQRQVMLVVGPSAILLGFMGLSGVVAVRVLKAPELFAGVIPEILGYGILAMATLSLLTKGRVFAVWLSAWLNLHAQYQARVKKLEAVFATLDANGVAPVPPAPKPWTPSELRPERTRPILPSEQLRRAKDNTGNIS
jgi:hypothetical protein